MPKTFAEELGEALRPKITSNTIADELGFSRTTVVRWLKGISEPHPLIKQAVREWIKEKLE